MTGSIHFPARMAGLLGVALLAAGCSSTAPSGYGVSAPKFNDEAMMRQQVANDEPTADSRGMYLSLIREMQGKGLYFASLAHIDAFEQRHGAAPDVELLRAHALREAGQGLGLRAGARGDYPAAVVSLREAARLDPTNALIVSDLGYALLRNGETAAARLPMAQAAELAPENSRILANLALLMLVSGDAGRAGTVMDKAGLSPDARVAVRKLADDIARRAPQASRPVAVVKADPAPAAIPVPPPAASPFPVSSLAPEMSRVPMAPGVERATVMPRTAVVRTAAQESEPTDTVREPAVRQVSAPVLQPVRAPMQSMLDRFNSAIP